MSTTTYTETTAHFGHLLELPLPVCPNCDHLLVSHWTELGTGGCRSVGRPCLCTWDPACPVCGVVTSRHSWPEDPPGDA